jgi:DNA polymerase
VERFVGKTCILGLGYGMGAEKFRRTLEIGQAGISVKIELNEAERIVRLYRQKNFKVTQLWNECGSALTSMMQGGTGVIRGLLPYGQNRVSLPSKLHITYPLLRPTTNGFEYIADSRSYEKALTAPTSVTWTKIYGGKMVENIVQALASIVIREQMTRIAESGYTPLFQVHDEIVIAAPDASASKVATILELIMSTPPSWAVGLPVACEVGIADNYGDT